MSTPIPVTLAVALAGGTWYVDHLELWSNELLDHDTLEREAIAAWSAVNPRVDAVHLWLVEDDGWQEDPDIALEKRRRSAIIPDDLPSPF